MAFNSGYRGRRVGRLPIILGLAVALAVFFVNREGTRSPGSLARSGLEDTSAPLLTYLSMPFRGLESFVDDQRARRLAFSENRAMKDELIRLREVERERDLLQRKLDAISTYMVLPPVEEHRIVLARAVSETRGPFAQAALLNAGLDKGVRAGAAVTSTQGLFGHVLRVGDHSSRVLRLTDPESRIAVKNARTDARAVLRGDGSKNPRLTFIDDPEDFADGDALTTSGDEGVFPEGLRVGRVRVSRDQDGARVELYETGRTADWVRIYVRDPIVPPSEDELQTVMRLKTVEVIVEPEVQEAAPPGSTIGGNRPNGN